MSEKNQTKPATAARTIRGVTPARDARRPTLADVEACIGRYNQARESYLACLAVGRSNDLEGDDDFGALGSRLCDEAVRAEGELMDTILRWDAPTASGRPSRTRRGVGRGFVLDGVVYAAVVDSDCLYELAEGEDDPTGDFVMKFTTFPLANLIDLGDSGEADGEDEDEDGDGGRAA